MRKIFLLTTILVSMNTFANTTASHNLTTAVMQSFQNHANATQENTKLYGGKNISRSHMTNANESIWSGQPTFIG